MKKTLSLVLALIMVAGIIIHVPMTAVAASSGTCGDNITWMIDNGTLTITGTGNMKYYYTSSDVPWYSDRTNIKTVVISEGISNIGPRVFSGCTKLTSVTIPGTVTHIGDSAFYGCTSLKKITIPDSVTSIGYYSFENCTGFKSITIPESITSIGKSAFNGCTGLEAVYITDLVSWCNIDFDGSYANPLYYAGKLYLNDKLVTKLEIPDEVTRIKANAFYNCTSLKTLIIPDSVTNIAYSAFAYCSGLVSLTIGENVTYVGMYSFTHCTKLENIFWNAKNVSNFSSDSNTFCNIGNEGKGIKLVFGDSVEYIPAYLTYVSYADYTPNIKSIKFGKNVNRIGSFSFCYAPYIESLVFPESLTRIDTRAFYNCANITTVTIPVSLTSIGISVFYYCANLKYVFYEGNEKQWSEIYFDSGNTYLKDAKIHYESNNHSKSSWVTDKKATADAPGLKSQKCTVCGKILKTEKIPQLKCSTPKLKSVVNVATGIKFTWNKVTGADNYEIYRKAGSGAWKKIATVKGSVTSYTDKSAKSGTTYKYSVSAKNEVGSSKYNTTGLTIKYLADPVLKAPTSAKTGVTLKWSKVTGAQGYVVHRKAGSGKFVKLATVKGVSKVSYTDKSAKKGIKYTYKLQSYSGKTYSAFSNTKTITDKY